LFRGHFRSFALRLRQSQAGEHFRRDRHVPPDSNLADTERAQLQTADVARRLTRGQSLHEATEQARD
jgi:hypothetical protein